MKACHQRPHASNATRNRHLHVKSPHRKINLNADPQPRGVKGIPFPSSNLVP